MSIETNPNTNYIDGIQVEELKGFDSDQLEQTTEFNYSVTENTD